MEASIVSSYPSEVGAGDGLRGAGDVLGYAGVFRLRKFFKLSAYGVYVHFSECACSVKTFKCSHVTHNVVWVNDGPHV